MNSNSVKRGQDSKGPYYCKGVNGTRYHYTPRDCSGRKRAQTLAAGSIYSNYPKAGGKTGGRKKCVKKKGGKVTGGRVTGGRVTGGRVTGGGVTSGRVTGGRVTGGKKRYVKRKNGGVSRKPVNPSPAFTPVFLPDGRLVLTKN